MTMPRDYLRRLKSVFTGTTSASQGDRQAWSGRKPFLILETLEDRLVMSGNPYPALYQHATDYFNTAGGVLHTLTDLAQAKIPIVDKSFADLTKTNNVIQAINADIQQAQSDLMSYDQNTLAQKVADTFDKYLKPILVKPTVVQLGDDQHPNLIDVKLDLGSTIYQTQTPFGLALPGVPFKANGAVDAEVDWSLPVEFGVDADATFFVNPGQLDFHVFAGLADHSKFTGDLGFLYFSATSNHVGFDGHVTLNLDNAAGLTAPILTGNAGVDLQLSAGFSQDTSAPSIAADFYVNWSFTNDGVSSSNSGFGSHLEAGFKQVSFSFGDYLSQLVKPVVEKIQQITSPLQPFIKVVTTPLPLISDLAEVLGDKNGVTLLDIVGVVNGSGKIPEPYSTYVSLATDIIKITKLIDEFQLTGQNVMIPLDDVDLSGSQKGNDLRDIAANPDFLDPSKLDWSNLQKFASNIDPKVIEEKIHDACKAVGLGALGDEINSQIDALKKKYDDAQANGIDLEFPIIDDPTSEIANLLIGRDSDLVTFTAQLKLGPDNEQNPPGFDLPGFHVGLTGSLSIDAKLGLGVDTHGLREVAHDLMNGQGFNPAKLLDGNYVTADSHLDLSGTLGLTGGINYVAFHADVTLSLTAAASISILPSADKDGDKKIHLDEIPSQADKLFDIEGSLSGSLHAEAKVGIGPFSFGPSMDLGPAEFASFSIGKINPFRADENTVLATRAADGTLTLNIGPQAMDRKYAVDVFDEDYLVTHDDPKSGDRPGEAVLVTAFGVTQRFDGVTSIYADGGSGNDIITIAEAVTSPVELHGGDGLDRLEARGTGNAQLFGEGDNDVLVGGIGNAMLDGGAGDDHLNAGAGDATMHGGAGKDVLLGGQGHNISFGDADDDVVVGGTGINVLSGGSGNDHLVAGPLADTLQGDDGDDYLEAGPRTAQILGGAGQDQIVWHFQGEVDGKLALATPIVIDGGSAHDSFAFFGSATNDTVSLAKSAGQVSTVQLKASNGAGASLTIQFLNTEVIDIEGGNGSDQITVDDLANSQLDNVLVDVDDVNLTRLAQGDYAGDRVVVNGTPGADAISVQAEQDLVQITHDEQMIYGGITAITGLVRYEVRVGNVDDDLRIRALNGNDAITVTGITGPTTIYGNGNASASGSDNDVFTVVAVDDQSFVTGLTIDAGFGSNALSVLEPTQDPVGYLVSSTQISSGLLHTLSYSAPGGTFGQGVSLTTGPGSDNVQITSTLPGIVTSINTGLGADAILVAARDSASLAEIQGTLAIEAGGGANSLTLDDRAASSGNHQVAVHAHSVTGFAGPSDNAALNFQATQGQLQLHLLGSNQPDLNEQFLIDSPAAMLTLDTGAGGHVVNVVGLTQPAQINEGAGADTINVGYSTNNLQSLLAPLTVSAGGGNDLMNVLDQAAQAGHGYVVTDHSLSRTGAGLITFDGTLEQLALQTTEWNDSVSVPALAIGQALRVDAHHGADQLIGPDADSVWTVNQNNGGQLGSNILFAGFENLTGGASNDHFILGKGLGISGVIDGAGGNDTLDYTPYASAVTINIQTLAATNVGGWKNLEEFVAGASSQDVFTGPDLPNSFHISGPNAGSLQTLGAGNFTFRQFENLRGGSQPDMFLFAPGGQLVGSIDGAAGVDQLDYSAFTYGVSVNLSKLTASQVGVQVLSIEGATGGEGNDVLIGDANPNIFNGNGGNDLLIGNAGNDSLNGGAGADILIGGAGADTLNAGLDEDLLIGGSTSYDANSAALAAIMAEWGSGDSYSHRVAHLRGQAGGLNGPYFLKSTTVLEDNAIDTLTGGVDKNDWFWVSKGILADIITDLDPAHEFVN
jgi:Ca2+-binding RTX toxin-like protein